LKRVTETVPTYQVAEVLREHMLARGLSARQVDERAGYTTEGRITRRILSHKHATIDVDKALALIEGVGGDAWEIPDYQMIGRSRRFIRLRMLECACGCGERTLSHYVDILANGKHRWRKKVGLDEGWGAGKQSDQVFLRGHKSRMPEMRQHLAETTSRAWTPERRKAHSERMKTMHASGHKFNNVS
jgi:hypothetical protein